MATFRIIAAEAVPAATRAAGEVAFGRALKDMDLPAMQIEWVVPVDDRSLSDGPFAEMPEGATAAVRGGDQGEPVRVFLRADATPAEAVTAALHEARHLCQLRCEPFGTLVAAGRRQEARAAMEADACDYARRTCGQFNSLLRSLGAPNQHGRDDGNLR